MDALGIVNFALRRLSEKVIASFDADSTAARACLQYFAPAMDEVTSEAEWSFAKKRAALAEDTTSENLTDYTYMYEYPSDALRLVPDGDQYEIEGNRIYSDVEDLSVVYIRSLVNTVDPTTPAIVSGVTLPTKFYMACALRLASHVALIVNKMDYLGVMQQEYGAVLRQAKNHDAMQNPGYIEQPDNWHEVQ